MRDIQFKAPPILRGMAGGALLAMLALAPAPGFAQHSPGMVSYPAGGEVIVAGEDCRIRWDSTGLQSTLTIRLWDGEASEWGIIATDVSTADLEYTWSVSENLSGQRFRIRLDDGSRSILNAAYFNVEEPAELEKPYIETSNAFDRIDRAVSVTVLPNPASYSAILRADAAIAHVTITSLAGQAVRAIEGNGGRELQMPLTGLAAGVYLVETLLADGQRVITRFIVR